MADTLKPLNEERCHRCGENCRIERFQGGILDGVVTLYMCANSTKFGGDCPDLHAYLTAEAWNRRTAISPDGVEERVDPDAVRRLLSTATTLETCGKHGIPIDFAMLASDIRSAIAAISAEGDE